MTPHSQIKATLSSVVSLSAVCVVVLLAGCARPNGGRPEGVSAAQVAACRQRSEEIYLQQNRAEIYQNDIYTSSTRDAPFGGSSVPGGSTASLSAQFGRQKALNDCYNSTTGTSDVPVEAPAAAKP